MKNVLEKLKNIGWDKYNTLMTEFPIIMDDNKMIIHWNSKMSGIYYWYNKLNKKMYIGCANDLYKRVYGEKNGFRLNKHGNLLKLYNAVKKYGIENFSVYKLLECDKSKLKEIEILFIKLYNTKNNGYNCTFGGEGTHGHIVSKQQIKKQKEKMKLYWTDEKKKEHSEKMKQWANDPCRKQHLIDVGKSWILNKNIIKKHKKKCQKSLTIERIKKQKQSLLNYYKINKSKKSIKITLYNPNNEIIQINGLYKFCINNHLSYPKIKNVIDGIKIHHKGWHIDKNFIYSVPKFKIISPTEEIHEFTSISKFCKENNLHKSGIINVIKGKSNHHKKWHI